MARSNFVTSTPLLLYRTQHRLPFHGFLLIPALSPPKWLHRPSQAWTGTGLAAIQGREAMAQYCAWDARPHAPRPASPSPGIGRGPRGRAGGGDLRCIASHGICSRSPIGQGR